MSYRLQLLEALEPEDIGNVRRIYDPGERFTFADVSRLSAGFARALAEREVRRGDRIAVMLTNRPAFPLTWLAWPGSAP